MKDSTSGWLERIFEDQYIDREWWGDFPAPVAWVGKNIHFKSLSDLVAVSGKIALHLLGEIPSIVLSNKAPHLSVNPSQITLNIKLLRLNLAEEIQMEALFGCFIHEVAHILYTRKEAAAAGNKTYTKTLNSFIHLIEDRRVESKLVLDFPAYHHFLYTARRLYASVGWGAIEKRIGFYGGISPESDAIGKDGTEALCDYIATFILFPHFLEDPFYIKDVRSFPGNERKIQEINRLLKNIRNYAKLSFREVEALAEELARVVGVQEIYYENFYLKEMKNTLRGIENYKSDQEVRLAESVIRSLQKTFNPAKQYTYLPAGRSEDHHTQTVEKTFIHQIREVEAESGEISENILNKARELAMGIQLQLSMFSAKTDKCRILYEQDSGELDEEELYQSRFNKNVFWEEILLPAISLEIVVLLDLSGSMVTGGKIPMQITLSLALALAFEKYANSISYSIYGHRCDDDGIEITCFHKRGTPFRMHKLFSQEANHANADGYALAYCLQKFQTDAPHRLFLMVSDGTPSVIGYEGEDAKQHVREVVDEAKRRHIEVLSLGIDNFDQGEMYDEFIPYSGTETATRLSQWLRRKFISFADEAIFAFFLFFFSSWTMGSI